MSISMRTTPMLVVAIGVFSATTFTHAELTLSSPLALPGDAASSQAAGRQETPEISKGSTGYLAVWADNRSSLIGTGSSGPYFGEGLGTMIDIYAARLDASGALVDTTPIAISQGQYNQSAPRVGWNGQSWLVVWMTERQGDRYFHDVVGVRVSPGGVLLDSTPIVIHAAGSSINAYNPWCVSSDGTNWIVLWRDLEATGSIFTIAGARVAPSGAVLDPSGKTLRQDVWNSGANKASLAFAGDEFLMTWLEMSSGTGGWVVRGQRLNTALDPIGAVFTL